MGLIEKTVSAIAPQDKDSRLQARQRLQKLTMPFWAMGRIMDLAVDLAGMTRSQRPSVSSRAVVVMAADHGVTAEGVSKYPQEVTCQMIANFVKGGACINALARVANARVMIVDMGVAGDLTTFVDSGVVFTKSVAKGTANLRVQPAMTREQAVQAVESGIEVALAVGPENDLTASGDMGIGNTTASAAVVAAMTGKRAAEVTGRGTGVEGDQFDRKVAIVDEALDLHRPDPTDALDVLSKIGGFEIGGIAGLILGLASLERPVIIDGLISTAGALIAHGLAPACADYVIAAHKSVERGHMVALEYLGKRPLMDLDMRLGEGTGAVLAMPFAEAAFRMLTEVATFEEAAVSEAKT